MIRTIGILESNSIAKGIEAADIVLKTADVSLLYARPVCPGKYSVLFHGDVAAVQASLESGKRFWLTIWSIPWSSPGYIPR